MFPIPEVPPDADHIAETAHAEETIHKMINLLESSWGGSAPDPSLQVHDVLHSKFPDKVQSHDDAVVLVREASELCNLSKALLQNVKFQLIKAQQEVNVMTTKCNATEDYFREVISLVAESGYGVSISAGKEPKVTVKKVSGNTVTVVSIPSRGPATSVDVVLD
ncbi:hypothetical protein D9619_002093 [Psilocybe cf. subviscida]|uniref:Uncharacterized protein n=1 Tax=Psilocybe cf. subviscida TaxID=2480587 RepID=A0A8H5BFE7_9AGAR|nr:hypothetical protein D9619_002093 [Psilocybe cf. subviscida]